MITQYVLNVQLLRLLFSLPMWMTFDTGVWTEMKDYFMQYFMIKDMSKPSIFLELKLHIRRMDSFFLRKNMY